MWPLLFYCSFPFEDMQIIGLENKAGKKQRSKGQILKCEGPCSSCISALYGFQTRTKVIEARTARTPLSRTLRTKMHKIIAGARLDYDDKSLFPCGKPCSTKTHDETVKKLVLFSAFDRWNHDRKTAVALFNGHSSERICNTNHVK